MPIRDMATQLTEIEYQDASVVLLFDQKDLMEIQLDAIRRQGRFDAVTAVKQLDAVVLGSEQHSERVTIQATRLEYRLELRTPFAERSLDGLDKLLSLLPELSVRSFGVNFSMAFVADGIAPGGQFISQRFVKQPTGIDDADLGPLFSSSIRMLFGSPELHTDIRITPVDLLGGRLVFQYHTHRDEIVKDRERLYRVLAEQYRVDTQRMPVLMGRF